jgi:hypothetical protein
MVYSGSRQVRLLFNSGLLGVKERRTRGKLKDRNLRRTGKSAVSIIKIKTPSIKLRNLNLNRRGFDF